MDAEPKPKPGFRNIAAVLRHRNYRLLWTGTLVSNSGDWMDQVALNWLVLETTGSAVYLGLVNLFRAVPILALTLIGGVAADRFERRRLMMMVSQAVGMVLAITLAVLVALGQTQIWIILAIASGRGAMVAFNQPARHTLISEVVPRHILPSAIALNSLTFNLTKIIGPLLAGIIIATWGTAACFAVNALSFIVVLWMLALMQFPPRPERERGESVVQSLLVGFAYLRTNRLVLIAMALSCNPTLLIADEPTTALDVTIQAQILEVINGLKRELGMSVIMITHDLGVVAGMADRIVVMYAGRVVEEGTTREVLKNPRMPYTIGLLRSIPRLDDGDDRRLTPIRGGPPNVAELIHGCPFAPRCDYAVAGKCDTEAPPLREVTPQHRAACHFDVTLATPPTRAPALSQQRRRRAMPEVTA